MFLVSVSFLFFCVLTDFFDHFSDLADVNFQRSKRGKCAKVLIASFLFHSSVLVIYMKYNMRFMSSK